MPSRRVEYGDDNCCDFSMTRLKMTEKKCTICISSPPIKGDKNTNWVEFAGKSFGRAF
jgi:hypothetical protein